MKSTMTSPRQRFLSGSPDARDHRRAGYLDCFGPRDPVASGRSINRTPSTPLQGLAQASQSARRPERRLQ
jgi:hypothetical protein